MRKICQYTAVVFAALAVAAGLCMDFDQSYIMGGRQKLLIYATPVFVLIFNMVYQMTHTDDPARRAKIRRYSYIVMFAIYLIAAGTVLFLENSFRRTIDLRTVFPAEPFTQKHVRMYINRKPFKTISLYIEACSSHTISVRLILANLLGNLIVFMPFALFLPVIRPRTQEKWRYFVPTVMLACVVTEFIQFITMMGQADVDDVILNTAGACILYAIRKLLCRSKKLRVWIKAEECEGKSNREG